MDTPGFPLREDHGTEPEIHRWNVDKQGRRVGSHIYVPPNRKKRFEELFEEHAKSLGMVGSVEFLP